MTELLLVSQLLENKPNTVLCHKGVLPHSHKEAASSWIGSLMSDIPERMVHFLASPIASTHSVDIFVQGL
jgi:hypothetical protein